MKLRSLVLFSYFSNASKKYILFEVWRVKKNMINSLIIGRKICVSSEVISGFYFINILLINVYHHLPYNFIYLYKTTIFINFVNNLKWFFLTWRILGSALLLLDRHLLRSWVIARVRPSIIISLEMVLIQVVGGWPLLLLPYHWPNNLTCIHRYKYNWNSLRKIWFAYFTTWSPYQSSGGLPCPDVSACAQLYVYSQHRTLPRVIIQLNRSVVRCS